MKKTYENIKEEKRGAITCIHFSPLPAAAWDVLVARWGGVECCRLESHSKYVLYSSTPQKTWFR
jgi:hypothetical protein